MIVLEPKNLAEALAVKGDHPEAVLLAGGTDLVPAWESETIAKPEKIITLTSCKELRFIKEGGNELVLGAMATHADLAGEGSVLNTLPSLKRAASIIGAPAIRNMGTMGGNLVTASPAADLPPVLMVYDATVVAASAARGRRSIPIASFFIQYRETALEPDELLIEVRIPVPDNGACCFFRKVGARKSLACSKMSLALFFKTARGSLEIVRIAAGSVAPIPVRLGGTEKYLSGKKISPAVARSAGEHAAKEVVPIDDLRSTARYRRHVLAAVLEEFLLQ